MSMKTNLRTTLMLATLAVVASTSVASSDRVEQLIDRMSLAGCSHHRAKSTRY